MCHFFPLPALAICFCHASPKRTEILKGLFLNSRRKLFIKAVFCGWKNLWHRYLALCPKHKNALGGAFLSKLINCTIIQIWWNNVIVLALMNLCLSEGFCNSMITLVHEEAGGHFSYCCKINYLYSSLLSSHSAYLLLDKKFVCLTTLSEINCPSITTTNSQASETVENEESDSDWWRCHPYYKTGLLSWTESLFPLYKMKIDALE